MKTHEYISTITVSLIMCTLLIFGFYIIFSKAGVIEYNQYINSNIAIIILSISVPVSLICSGAIFLLRKQMSSDIEFGKNIKQREKSIQILVLSFFAIFIAIIEIITINSGVGQLLIALGFVGSAIGVFYK